MIVRALALRVSRAWRAVPRVLASERFYWFALAFFIFQALWLVATARYPMAFDENFHYGLIKLHATQWLPFFTSQPASAAPYGAVVRDPSYLYHYVLSFPYRLVSIVTANDVARIITLRVINVGLAVSGLALSRRVLFRLGASRALAHSVLLIITLIPVVPFLAAQINYDNLFWPLVLLAILSTCCWLDAWRAGRVSLRLTLGLGVLFALSSLVKYAFLPIAAALTLTVIWHIVRDRHVHSLAAAIKKSAQETPRWQLAVLAIGCILSFGLFTERYGYNLAVYHTPDPDCGKVLDVATCAQYGPWARDYNYEQELNVRPSPTPLTYPIVWLYGMWYRCLFAISDTYDTQDPLPILSGWTIVLAVAACWVTVRYGRWLWRQPAIRVTAAAVVLYVAALFAQTFFAYMKTRVPVAINGRYLVPVLPIMLGGAGLAFSRRWQNTPNWKTAAVLLTFFFMAQGGGTLTWIARSTDQWYWPNPVVISINRTLRQALSPLLVGSGHVSTT